MPERDGNARKPRRAPPVLQTAALGYDRHGDEAPKVLAKGSGEIAERILARADELGIPVERDPDLLQCLGSLEVGEEIPLQAYEAVAQILAFLYRKNAES